MGIELFGWYFGRKPEPVEVEKVVTKEITILGAPEKATLFLTQDPGYRRALGWPYGNVQNMPQPAEWHGRYYLTCEQAFAECPGAEVHRVERWRVGEVFVSELKVETLVVQPKPKVPKGKRA